MRNPADWHWWAKIEPHRIRSGQYASTSQDGRNGAFQIPNPHRPHSSLAIICSDQLGWEHLSIHIITQGGDSATPTWQEMSAAKDLFWTETETVIQIHPPKALHVNTHPHTLHLWKPTEATIPLPPIQFV